jgi:ABC-type lipoprotein release transport system permease subunit
MGAGLSVAGLMMLTTDDAALIRQLALRTARSPWWWAVMSVLLSLAALLSTGAPVTRALRIDPARILRDDV